ncbi:O-antigen ligase family protein [Streptomyces sp. NPDC091292]|uniref:O-antigen ligase family protein n=1 Tax=Streptomyces sp. NPDC091292 TaxID=3365991 RepID=UPI0037F8B8E5
MVLLAACSVWSLITATAGAGRPEGVLLAVLAVAAAYACGRICGALLPVSAPGAGALAGVSLALLLPHTRLMPQETSPLGRDGATAALLALATGAACCGAWAARRPAVRLALRLAAVGVVATALVLDSTAGFAVCVGVLLCSLAAARMRNRGLGLAGLGLATALTAGTTWAVAGGVLPYGLESALEGQLTPYRVLLWRDALDMAEARPALGAGPGRFGELSPTVAESLVPAGRPHSALLQQAAEQGVVGAGLLGAVFCWLLYALWRSPRSTPVVLTAGAALTAVAALATVGNALSFTAVTVGAGLLAGIATARPLGWEPPEETDGAGLPSQSEVA